MELRRESILCELSEAHAVPCVSIYLKIGHGRTGCHQNLLRLKNLKREAVKSLSLSYSDETIQQIIEPIERLSSDASFWNYQRSGVALFAARGFFRVVRSGAPFEPLAIVADRFHIKPLIRLFQSIDRFYVISVSLNQVCLLAGDQFGIEEIELDAPKISIDDFAAFSDGDRHMSSVSTGGGTSQGGRRARAVYHNYDDYGARRKIDIGRYFAAVDALVRRRIGSEPDRPVILAALSEHQSIYREQSKIVGLLPSGICHNPDPLSKSELQAEAFGVLAPMYTTMTKQLASEYSDAKERGLASDHLQEIGRALVRGRVGKLIVEQECKVPGRFIEKDGLILFADLQNPHVNDLLDDFADVTLRSSGDVVVLPHSQMPSDTGVAAIYRY